jgi:cystathionine beta-lyase/cystathionine gamma-synthase
MTSFTQLTRRQFLTTIVSATAVSLAVPHLALAVPRQVQMKLSFMTWVCPTWPIEKIVTFAKEAGYDGVEIRVDAKHKHDISSQSSAGVRRQTKTLFAAVGVEIAAVATSVQFANPEPQVLKTNLESAKANLELAADLVAPVVRIFAGGGILFVSGMAAISTTLLTLLRAGDHAVLQDQLYGGTHAFVADLFRGFGITDALLRLSVGIEHAADLIADLTQALDGNNARLPP